MSPDTGTRSGESGGHVEDWRLWVGGGGSGGTYYRTQRC